jgi:ABC-type glutathione transport system ATPase component
VRTLDASGRPQAGRTPIAEACEVVVAYRGRRRSNEAVNALNAVSLAIPRGVTVGLVGESGSGKTTLARVLLGLLAPQRGSVEFDGRPMTGRHARSQRKGRIQAVLQNPDWSLNPSLRVWRSVAEPLAITSQGTRRERRGVVEEMLAMVGLDVSIADRRPHELSGGQRQRVAIARAMITHPDLIVFDEAVSALDASVQTQVLNLIKDLQTQTGFAALFISHDLAAVRYVADDVAVLYRGDLVEYGPVRRFYEEPTHPYSRALLSSTPTLQL